jgi:hypothetical protein
MKNMAIHSANLRRVVNSGTGAGNIKGLEQWESFRQTAEYLKFLEMVEKEHEEVVRIMSSYREEVIRWLSNSQGIVSQGEDPKLQQQLIMEVNDAERLDSLFFRQQVFGYVEDLKKSMSGLGTRFSEGGDGTKLVEYEKKLLLHSIEVSDILILDECFDNFMDVNMKYNDQKYFLSLRNSNTENLRHHLQQKIEYCKSKVY